MRRPAEPTALRPAEAVTDGRPTGVLVTNPWRPDRAQAPETRKPSRGLLAAAALVVVLPYLYDLVRIAIDSGQHVYIWGDDALEALSTRDVWKGHVLFGAYSRYGWHHPGPALYYLLAVPDRIFGSNGAGIIFGTVLLNAVAAAAIVIVLGRRWGLWMAAWAAGCVSLLHIALGGYLWRDFWNPFAIVMPIVLLIVLCADAATGNLASWCWALVVGSYAVQTHVSTAPTVLAVGLLGLVGLVWARVRGAPVRLTSPLALTGVGAAVLVWVPPLIDAVRHRPSNLSTLINFFTAHHPAHSIGEASRMSLAAATTVFYGRHGWISLEVARPTRTLIMGAVIFTALVVVTIAIGFRRRQWLAIAMAVVSSVGFGAAVLSVTRVVGEIGQYLVLWQSFVPITLLIGLGAALLAPGTLARPATEPAMIPPPGLRLSKMGQAAAAIGVAGALIATALAVGQTAALAGPTRFPGYLAPGEQIEASKAVLAALRPTDRVIRFTITTQSAWPPIAGVALDLERRGLRTTEATTPGAGVDPGLLFGASHHPTGHEDVDIQVQRSGPTEVQGVPAKGAPLAVIGSLVLLINRPAQ